MYWNSVPATSVNFEVLLRKENVTLQEIMDDDGVLQECRSQNRRLIEYLVQSDVLEKLVRLTIEEPSGNEDDAVKYKYSNIACELLTCEVSPLSEILANDKALLGKLYSFLDTDAPLNPLLASFFSKTLSVLITRNSERNLYSYHFTCLKVLEFLKLKEDSISLLLKHLGTSAIMDLIFKLVTKVEGSDLKDIVLNWLDEQNLVQRLVALLDPSVDSDRHYNAAQLLCDLVNVLRNDKMEVLQQNEILDRIESPEVVNLLLDHILKEPKCETSISGGISVILALLEDKWHGNGRVLFDENTQSYVDFLKVVASTTKAILPRLKNFHDILINPPLKPAVRTTITVLEPPLGSVRVEVAKLLSVLIASDNVEINKELAELDTINVLLDLFFKYTWNNFFHKQVQKCLVNAFNLYPTSEGSEIQRDGLVAHILSKCRIIQRILDAWDDNELQQTEHKRPRRGYMGHLIEIANKIFFLGQTHSFRALMEETVDKKTLKKWKGFVNTKLFQNTNCTNCIQETYMGGSYPLPEKDGGVGKDDSFGNFSQELYSNYYQLQSLAPLFTGAIGSFQESQFNDNENIMNISTNPNFDKINFNVPEEESDQQAVFFEKVCSQKFQTLDDYNGDCQAQENSSSDEDDEDNADVNKNQMKNGPQLEFNQNPPWPEETENSVPPAESLNPWESSSLNSVASPDLGWANFESASFVANFGMNFTPDINTTIATSASYEADPIPLDLTPNENCSNIDEIFAQGEPQLEVAQVEENNPTMVEILTDAIKKVSLNSDMQNSSAKEQREEETAKATTAQETSSEVEKINLQWGGGQLNCTESPPGIIGDVNSIGNVNEEKESLCNSRFLSSQGGMTKDEKESEGGDSYQLLKENVQAVPNETTQISTQEVGVKNNPEDKSANGPI